MDRDEFIILAKYLHSISFSLSLLVVERTQLPRESRDLAFRNHQDARKDFWEILNPFEEFKKLEKEEKNDRGTV